MDGVVEDDGVKNKLWKPDMIAYAIEEDVALSIVK